MRKILATAVLACLFLGAAAPQALFAQSEESVQVGKNVFLSLGMKTWINTWQTNLTGNSGKGWTMLTSDPRIGVIPSASLKLKRFLISGSFMVTPDYRFPRETFYTTGAGSSLYSLDITGSRREYDLNFGFYVSRSVVLTMGYKGITEKFRVENSRTGTSENKVYMNGITLGIAGSAPIGSGFSVYGSGAGGWMGVTYTPNSRYVDNGLYESSEMGLAWKAPGRVPLSLSLGYKFQLIQTKIRKENNANYESLPRNEVTRGPVLGLNLVF